ncbi:hypothetical protein A2899_01610 [Candidatus Amesbacteria bacterium RIFCSPLOWO2_01_FULL_49_25]|uniref:FAD-binding FR-type domain-containing protein n=1 Tax=Candidatus Amesbacteria bacterium RIFCSPHIGHO2_01_FULL_48_32b TaxID=1797253 RepID=A0A1F4YD71_9BACT|nr:MAG: hypothetical protein A2876_03270 [Candidatus Amesbacteria bacterium RIFCSPHIGHO2_01_FULL_48_32b]OGD08472.1 MAG: hypothetical protein A2899_01610 [Candidatus Amesbacteria bacterium RIFCSPLOWO2_01_FULL_49_25]
MHARVIFLKRLSKNYWLLQLTKPEGLNFKAGQYISLKVHPDGHRRSYSLSDPPSSSHMNLLADVSPMGLGSKYILSLHPGSLVDFIGPLGKFIKTSDGLFLAGGSGIAPFLSMRAGPILWSLHRKSEVFDTGLNPLIFYTRDFLTQYLKSIQDLKNYHIYLCGSRPYVSGMTKLLISLGVISTQLHAEKFV